MKPTEFFKKFLHQLPGPWKIGQVMIHLDFVLTHEKDAPNDPNLQEISLEVLTERIKKTNSGEYRPLHASPNLPRGWKTSLLSERDLVLALRILYPNSLSLWTEWKEDRVRITPFLETAERQTGMYHCTRLLTSEELHTLTEGKCRQSCLKKRLWEPVDTITAKPSEIPLLCTEACNFLVAQAREVIKSRPRKESATTTST